MENSVDKIVKKVIMASAGTGKTYRLSLEYIAILLKYRIYKEFDFSQIVVMTFTRKATAEIREKILDFLKVLSRREDNYLEIVQNLESISNYKVTEDDFIFIKAELLPSILERKDLLQVSTIDSFTTNIFKTMIAPFLKINEFSIDNNANNDLMPMLLNFMLNRENLPIFEPILKKLNLRTIESSEKFVHSLLNNRWLLEFVEAGDVKGDLYKMYSYPEEEFKSVKEKLWSDFKSRYLELINKYDEQYFTNSGKELTKVILKDYMRLSFFDEEAHLSLQEVFKKLFDSPKYIKSKIALFYDKPFPFTTKVTKEYKELFKELKEEFNEVIKILSDYYLIDNVIPQEKEIIEGWKLLCTEYDKLKFSFGKFTYTDITFYTYKYLYEESLSLIDREHEIVTNVFYEQLTSRVRFLLIDEFQDTSINQYNILLPMIKELISGTGAKDYSGVVIVGDPKQSIYGWRGGERGIMNAMPKILGVEAEDLDTCYRSTKPVIDIINRVFTDDYFQNDSLDNNRPWDYKEVGSAKSDRASLHYWEHNSNDTDSGDEQIEIKNSFEHFVDNIANMISLKQIKRSETAILVRSNAHATAITDELNRRGIPNVIESSDKLFNHKAVKLIIAALKFRLWRDHYSMLVFLRSDLVLLESSKLLKILTLLNNDSNRTSAEIDIELGKIEEVTRLLQLTNGNYSSESDFVQALLMQYNFEDVCSYEIDWKNIYSFVDILLKFEIADIGANSLDLYGFMEYCQKHIDSDSDILQKGLKVKDSITILTVHKSKGLGFKNVFVYWKLSNKKGGRSDGFEYAFTLDKENNRGLDDFIILPNSDARKAVARGSYSEVINSVDDRSIVEAVDVLYVALTRAEERLALFVNYDKKGGWEPLVDSLKGEAAVMGMLINGYKNFFMEHDVEPKNVNRVLTLNYSKGMENIEVLAEQKEILTQFNLTNFTDKSEVVEFEENKTIENMKKIYLEDKHQLYGNVAHFYLAYVKHGTSEELDFAYKMVLQMYGSLLTNDELKLVKNSCLAFIKNNKDIFSPIWDTVFNEKVVFDEGREYRIDRMMISHVNKEIMIIDYKTGQIDDDKQVETYIEIISKNRLVRQKKYTVKGDYASVDVY